MLRRIWEQSEKSRALHGRSNGTLVLRASTTFTPIVHLGALHEVTREHRSVFIVDETSVVATKLAAAPPWTMPPASAPPALKSVATTTATFKAITAATSPAAIRAGSMYRLTLVRHVRSLVSARLVPSTHLPALSRDRGLAAPPST